MNAHPGRVRRAGGRIAGEVLFGVVANDPESYLALAPGWRPTLPARDGEFRLSDLLVPHEGL